jgi:hypothetical protein
VKRLFWGLLLASGCSSAPRAAAPPAPRDPSLSPEWHLHLDTRGKRLGAYTIAIRFDPAVAVLHEVQPCAVRHFRGNPECDPASFRTGLTRVAAFETNPSRLPDDEYHLLTVTFRRVAPGTFEAKAEIEKLYDDANKPLKGRITVPTFRME